MVELKKIKRQNAVTVVVLLIIITMYIYTFGFRYAFITSNSIVDSTLQVKLAMSICKHNWLGQYNDLTLAKGISFPLILAIFNKFHIPFTLGICFFNIFCVTVFLIIVIPFFHHKRIAAIIMLFAFLFNPVLFTATQVLPYRDTTTYGACILIISWSIGMVLNFALYKNKLSLMFTLLSGVLGLTYWQNLREDSGWVYPFIIISSFVITIYLLKIKEKRLISFLVVLLSPLLLLLVADGMICYKNYTHYNRFVVNEYRSNDFKAAIGTMSSVRNKDWVINVPVNTKARNDMYKYVPLFRKLKKYLDTNESGNVQTYKFNGIKEPSFGNDYQGGWFPWAYRLAVYRAGYANDSQDFKIFNEKLSDQIVKASKEGKLNGSVKIRRSLVPPLDIRIVKPVFKESFVAFNYFVFMKDFTTEIPIYKELDGNLQSKMSKFLRSKFPLKKNNGILKSSTINLYKNIYIFFETISFILLFMSCSHMLSKQIHNRIKWNGLDWLFLIDIGLFLLVILRVVMLAYVTVTSFPALSSAYLSSTYSLSLVLVSMLALTVDFKFKKEN